jgi:hypothetical protein
MTGGTSPNGRWRHTVREVDVGVVAADRQCIATTPPATDRRFFQSA